MEPRQQERTFDVGKDKIPKVAKPRRFRIERLEERIAPANSAKTTQCDCGFCYPIYKWGDHGQVIGYACGATPIP